MLNHALTSTGRLAIVTQGGAAPLSARPLDPFPGGDDETENQQAGAADFQQLDEQVESVSDALPMPEFYKAEEIFKQAQSAADDVRRTLEKQLRESN